MSSREYNKSTLIKSKFQLNLNLGLHNIYIEKAKPQMVTTH
jgi:hypothetical protein